MSTAQVFEIIVSQGADVKEAAKQTLISQREQIPDTVEKAIDIYLKTKNISLGRNLLMAIDSFDDPEEGFRQWCEFAKTQDKQSLRDYVSDQNISYFEFYKFLFQQTKELDCARGKDSESLSRKFGSAVKAGLNMALLPLFATKIDGLSPRQLVLSEAVAVPANINSADQLAGDLILSAIAPLMAKEIAEKWTSSLAELRQAVKTPLLSEDAVRSLYDQMLENAYAQYDKAAAQLGRDNVMPTPGVTALYPFNIDPAATFPEGITVGVEIEGFTFDHNPKKSGRNQAFVNMMKRGLSLTLNPMPKTGSDYKKWSVVFDGSIINPYKFEKRFSVEERLMHAGFEVVSPILEGTVGHNDLKKAVEALVLSGLLTNDSCGMHVHIGLQERSMDQKKNLALALYRNRDALDTLLTPSRRANLNQFCKAIPATVTEQDILAIETDQQLVDLFNPQYDRNYKYDFTSVLNEGTPGTIQFRGQGGSDYIGVVDVYTTVLANFVDQAFDNPDVTLKSVMDDISTDTPASMPSWMVKVAQDAPGKAIISVSGVKPG